MAEPVATRPSENSEPQPVDFATRESEEIVVSFSGAIGSGLSEIVEQAANILKGFGYEIKIIKISDFIQKIGAKEKRRNRKHDQSDHYLTDDDISAIRQNQGRKFELLQTAGNELRADFSLDILAELAVADIATHRTIEHRQTEIAEIVPNKTAYLIDQLKHPAEVQLLRKVYGNLFYQIGVFASESQREANLKATLTPEETFRAMRRDRREEETHGQQLDKTLKLSDLFLRNNQANRLSIQAQIKRFFQLIHREEILSPTKDEYGMYTAFAAGMRSACLSRQVGAAIMDRHSNLIATGCNDVPKAGGGLYSDEDGDKDKRCIRIEDAKCHNDFRKQLLAGEIGTILNDAGIEPKKIGAIVESIRNAPGIKSIVEYSRSVHAEMDAITTIARSGGTTVTGGTLYSTTYPCHNCARHIISAGISRVLYLEPYEKSLAMDLHKDAIADDTEDEQESPKVRFLHFEGIAPRQYQYLFLSLDERKEGGKAVLIEHGSKRKSLVQYLDSYLDLETKVVARLEKDGLLD